MPPSLIFLLLVVGILTGGAMLFGLMVRGAKIGAMKAAVIRSELVIRTIRTMANEYDRLDSVLASELISLINRYDEDRLKEMKK